MTAAIATLETVQAAIATLEARNIKVTADAIRKELDGGSQGTIVKLLARIRSATAEAAADSDRIADQSRKIIADALAAVSRIERAAASEDFQEERRSQQDIITRMVKDAHDAGEMLEAKDAELHQAVERLRETDNRLSALEAERDDLSAQFARAQEEIATLQALLVEAEATRKPDPMLIEIFSTMRELVDRSNSSVGA